MAKLSKTVKRRDEHEVLGELQQFVVLRLHGAIPVGANAQAVLRIHEEVPLDVIEHDGGLRAIQARILRKCKLDAKHVTDPMSQMKSIPWPRSPPMVSHSLHHTSGYEQ